jgi:hypothetical protein
MNLNCCYLQVCQQNVDSACLHVEGSVCKQGTIFANVLLSGFPLDDKKKKYIYIYIYKRLNLELKVGKWHEM